MTETILAYINAQQALADAHARLLELWKDLPDQARQLVMAPAELTAQLLERGGWRVEGGAASTAGGAAPDPVGAPDATWPTKFPGQDV